MRIRDVFMVCIFMQHDMYIKHESECDGMECARDIDCLAHKCGIIIRT